MKSKKYAVARSIWDYQLFSKSRSSLLKSLAAHLAHSRKTAYIFTPNAEQLVQASKNDRFSSVLANSDFLLPDSWGLVRAYQKLHKNGSIPAPQTRISGREVAAWLVKHPRNKHQRILIVGGRDYARRQLEGRTVQLATPETEATVSGIWWTPGFVDVSSPQPAEQKQLAASIAAIKPTIVLVAFGAPWQEFWIDDNRALLEKHNVKIAMVVGGAIDYLLGLVPRCPDWLAKRGGEWFFRLVTQPWRFKRQLRLLKFLSLYGQELRRRS